MNDPLLAPHRNRLAEEDLPEPMRRSLLQIAAMLGGAVGFGTALGAAASTAAAAASRAAEVEAIERKLGLSRPKIEPRAVARTACAIYDCANGIRRLPQRELSFKTLSESLGVSWLEQLIHNARRNLGKNRIGRDTAVEDKAEARAALAFMLGARSWDKLSEVDGLGRENRGLLSWSPITVPNALAVPDPDDLTNKVKKMARFYGAAQVGICEIDRRWIYAETCRNIRDPGDPVTKPIVFRDVGRPQESDDELIIPESVKYAIVFIIPMSRAATQVAPASLMSHAAATHGYGQAGLTEIAVAEALRALGYSAIPCKQGVGQSVPLAVDAGLGQVGLHGHLVTPDHGSHVVVGKVLTDMPLVPDRPIEFGVTDYCASCGLCAEACPASAIPEGIERTIKTLPAGARGGGESAARNWYIEGEACLAWWAEAGAVCRHCLEVCPYTQFSLIDFWAGTPAEVEGFWDLDLPNFGVEDQTLPAD